jgi:hypothetical protein
MICDSITCDAHAQAAALAVPVDEVAAHVGHAVAGFAVALLFGPASFFAAAGRVVVEPAHAAAVELAHVVAARHYYVLAVHAGLRPAGFLLPDAEHCFLLPEPFDWHYFVLPVVFLLPVDWRYFALHVPVALHYCVQFGPVALNYFARFAVSLLPGQTTDLQLYEHAAPNVADQALPWQLSPDGHDLPLQKDYDRCELPAYVPFEYRLAVCGVRSWPFVPQDAALPSHRHVRRCSLRDCLQPYCVV